jgi:hypothetical protein
MINSKGETSMERTPVTSSNVCSIGYDIDSQILEVEFNNGAVYQYSGVPEYEYIGLMDSDSKGARMHSHIKNQYPCTKL